ncbi:MAG: hypothetical protein CMM08_17735, partial [Rhodospirillaceae bacterium]|nr:hypothetical protein [Rhodospirillaceae bacterium]
SGGRENDLVPSTVARCYDFREPGDYLGNVGYEVDFRMFANGVADHLVLDYGDFAVAGRLSRLEPLTEPGC